MLKQLSIEDSALWKRRFRTPVILGVELAKANPSRGLIATNKSGLYQLHAWDVRSGELRQLTDQSHGQLLGTLSPDGRYVYYLDDKDGSEIGHLARIPFEGGAVEDVTPNLEPYSVTGYFVSHNGSRLGLTVANADGFHLYVVDLNKDLSLTSPRLIYSAKSLAYGPFFSSDGEIAVMASTERTHKLDFGLMAFDTSSGELIGELEGAPSSSVEPVAFSPVANDFRLLAQTNKSGVQRPLLWNPRSGEQLNLALDEWDGEVRPLDWSPDAKRILLVQFKQAVQKLLIYELESDTEIPLNHPNGTFGWGPSSVFFGTDREIFAIWQDATHPPRLVSLDAATGTLIDTLLEAGEAPPGASWKSVSFVSSDGQEIQGWLSVPQGSGPFPTILHTHGGPRAVMTETFEPDAQSWLDHGFAYLTINYRGSTTFGREFQKQIEGDLGHWEVEDMVAARDWLVDQGVADPDKILLTGWSYGGYLTLQSLGKKPQLWAGGMAGIAIADWSMSYEDSSDVLRSVQVALLGGTPEEVPEQYIASSPISYIANVQAPVLIIQGRNDTRTPARPIEVYEQKMKALGKPIEVHWFNAGHLGSFADTELSIAHQELMLRFAYRVLDKVTDVPSSV